MPELVEAQIICDGLKGYVGNQILGIDDEVTRSNNILVESTNLRQVVIGSKIVDVVRNGKRPVMILEKDGSKYALDFFLSMSGCFRADELTNVSRVRFDLSGGTELYYEDSRMWGRARLHTYEEWEEGICVDAVDPLISDYAKVYNRLLTYDLWEGATLKDMLMDQTCLIGLGNFYSQEILYDAGFRPDKLRSDVSSRELAHIADRVVSHVQRAYKYGGLSLKNWHHVDGKLGEAQDFGHVYGKKNCTYCGTQVEKIDITGRSTYLCPRCQK